MEGISAIEGDRTIYLNELVSEDPYFLPLANFTSSTAHQAIAFQQKNMCQLRQVEFARAYRLTLSEAELSFTVPRKKMELFQNDLFPPSYVTWQAVVQSSDWIQGRKDVAPMYLDLKPAGMELLYPDLASGFPSAQSSNAGALPLISPQPTGQPLASSTPLPSSGLVGNPAAKNHPLQPVRRHRPHRLL